MSAPAPPEHPAATLRRADGLARIRDVARRCRAYRWLVEDLGMAARVAGLGR